MKIVIIEDEKITADDLADTIEAVLPESDIEAILSSVGAAVQYFQANPMPDLIFSDIQLGDGVSFDIFKKVQLTTPVIFCTAYDEYALEAFKTNSIDYILKPFTTESVEEALRKYRQLKDTFAAKQPDYEGIIEALNTQKSQKTGSILVHYKDKILPVKLNDIALFYIDTEIVTLITLGKNKYSLTKTLDEIDRITGDNFYRINRQCIVNRKAIVDVSHYFSGKLSVNICVPFDEKILVSKAKRPQFLEWLEME